MTNVGFHGFQMSYVNKLTRSPLWVLLIVTPLLLPDFYVWKSYFNDSQHIILNYLWLLGVALKYISLMAAVIVCIFDRLNMNYGIIVTYCLFFMCIAISTVAHSFGLAGLKDVWNQFMLGFPAVSYFPTVINNKSSNESDKRIIRTVTWFAAGIAFITVLMYVVFPEGFGTIFGACSTDINGMMLTNDVNIENTNTSAPVIENTNTSAPVIENTNTSAPVNDESRICGTFVGLHTTTILYGLILLASALLISIILHTSLPTWGALLLASALLFFSSSVTAKLEVLLLVSVIPICILLTKNLRFSKIANNITSPIVVHFIAIVTAFAIPSLSKTHWFITTMIHLHRDPTLSGRLSLYEKAISVFEKNPILGIGYNQKYYQSILTNSLGQHLSFPHNSYLQILMESGVLGLLVFSIFIYKILKNQKSLYYDTTKTMRNILFICAVVAGSTSGDFFEGRFYLLLVLLYCVNILQNKRHPEFIIKDYFTDANPHIPNKEKPNVLLFMTKLDARGIEHVYLSLIPRLTNDFNFVIARYGGGKDEIADQFSQIGCKIIRLNVNRFKHSIRFINALRQIIMENDITIFHSNVGYSTFFGIIAARLTKVPVRIAHSHSGQFGTLHNPLNGAFHFLCQLSCHFWATTKINVGEASRHSLFFKSDKSLFVPNGIDLDSFRFDLKARKTGRRKLNIDDSTEVFLHIGRMYPVKNHRFLIKAFQSYHCVYPNSLLLLAGDGELMDKLQDLVHNLSLSDAVIFLGNINSVSPLYSMSDCLIFPSLFEGLPVTLVEAQANGIPVFASDTIDKAITLSSEITFLSLSDGPEWWAKSFPDSPVEREIVKLSPELKKFDCSQTAKTIAQVYRGELK